MPTNEFSQKFTVDFSDVEAGLNQLSAKARTTAREAFAGVNLPTVSSGPSIAAQAATITAAIKRAREISGGPGKISKKVEDQLLASFGGRNFSAVTGDPEQAKRIQALQQQIGAKVSQELAGATTSAELRTRINTLLKQSASGLIGRGAVNEAKIGALVPPTALVGEKAAENQLDKALPPASPQQASQLDDSRNKLNEATKRQADATDKSAKATSDSAEVERQRKALIERALATQQRIIQDLQNTAATGSAGAGGGTGGPPPITGQPFDDGFDEIREAVQAQIQQFRQATAVNNESINNPLFARSKVALSTSENNLAAALAVEQASSESYITSKVRSEVAQNRLETALVTERANSEANIKATSNLAIARNRLATVEEQSLTSQAALDSAIDLRVAQLQRQAATDRAISTNVPFLNAQADTVVAEQERKAQEATALDARRSQIARARVTQEQVRIRQETEFVALSNSQLVIDRANLNAERALFAEKVKLEQLNLGLTQQLNAVKAQRIAAEQSAAQSFNKIVAAELKASGAGIFAQTRARLGGFSSGRFEGGSNAGGGIGGFLGGGLLSTARFALPSTLLFGAVKGIKDVVDEAESMERVLKQLESQLAATGQSGDFDRLRDSIKSIAVETGNAGQEVAEFAFQLQGAFGQDTIAGVSGANLVEDQLEAISKLNRITDIDNQQVVDSVTATSKAFNVLAEDIANTAVIAESNFGVSIDNIVNFLGDIAPVAQEAGFSLDELTALAALSQQRSGRSGTALAESFGRIIPAISGAKQELLQLAVANDALNTPEFLQAIASNDVKAQLFEIAQQFDLLSSTAQDSIIELLGGRREAQVLLTVIQDEGSLTRAVETIQNGAGDAFDKRFADLAATLNQRLAVLGEQFRQFGIAVFESGINDFLKDMLSFLGDILSVVTGMLGLWTDFNSALGGTPGLVAKISLAVVALNAILNKTAGVGILGQLSALGQTSVFGFGGGAAAASTSVATTTLAAGLGDSPGGRQLGQIAGASIASGADDAAALAAAKAGGVTIGSALATAAAGALAVAIGAGIGIGIGRRQELFGIDFSQVTGAQTQTELAQTRQEAFDRLLLADEEFIKGLARDQGNFFTNASNAISSFFTGVDTSLSNLAEEALAARRSQNLGGVIQNVVDSGLAIDSNEVFREIIAEDVEALKIPERRKALAEQFNAEFDRAQGQAINDFVNSLGVEGNILNEQVGVVRQTRSFQLDRNVEQFIGFDVDPEALAQLVDSDALNALIAEAVENQNGQALALLEIISGGTKDNDRVNAAIAEAERTRRSALSEADRAREDLQSQFIDIDAAKAAFEAGTGSFENYIKALDGQVQGFRELIALGDSDPNNFTAISEGLEERGKVFADFFKDQDDLTIELQKVIESDDLAAIQGEIDVLVNRLQDPNFTDPGSRFDYANQIIKLQQAFFQATVDNADNAEEALAIAEAGVPVLAEVRAEAIAAQIRAAGDTVDYQDLFNGSVQTLYIAGEEFVIDTADEFVRVVSLALVQGEESTQALKQALQVRLAQLSVIYARNIARFNASANEVVSAQIEDLQRAIGSLDTGGFETFAPDTNVIDPERINDEAAVEKARREVETAKAESERAADEARRAAEEAQRQAEDLAKARLDYALALVAGDPVKAAEIAVQQADLAYRQADSEADKLRAQAQRIQAQRSLTEAIRDIGEAQVELLVAQAEYAGDIVASSQVSLQLAQQRLSQLQQDFEGGNAGQADVIRGQADVVRAQAAARDAQLQSSLDDYQFLYDMERINKQQYIAYLQSLKQIPDLTEDQIRSIDRQIKGLSDELRSDFQFNLPSNIALPTLYEVRRTNQGTGNGIGYQDNRLVNINIEVSDNASIAAVEDLLEYHLGVNRTGTTTRLY